MNLIERYEQITETDPKKRAPKLYELLKDSRDLATLTELGKRERQKLSQRYSLASLGTKLSQAKYYALFRKPVLVKGENAISLKKQNGTSYLKHVFVHECGLSQEEWDKRNGTDSDRISQSLANARPLDPEAILSTAYPLLESNDRRQLTVGLTIATGRRPHEIFARAKFEEIENDNWHVQFTGQGKKRGEKPTFKIATLFPADLCRSALKRLRRDKYVKQVLKQAREQHPNDPTAQNQTIDSRTNSSHNLAVRKHLSDVLPPRPSKPGEKDDPNLTCTNLRAAYLVMATARDSSGSAGQKMLHAARLAGHISEHDKPSDSDLQHILTTLGYTYYHCDSVPHYPNDLAPETESPTAQPKPAKKKKLKRIDLLAEDLEQIRTWQKEWETETRYSTLSKIIELARQQLNTTAEPSTPAEHPTPKPTPEPEPITIIRPDPETDKRLTALEEKVEQLLSQLSPPTVPNYTYLASAIVPALAPAAPVTATKPTRSAPPAPVEPIASTEPPKPSKPAANPPEETARPGTRQQSRADRNAEAMSKYAEMSYSELTEQSGHAIGVSFARCQRAYEAMQRYNEQHLDPEQKIAMNKSLLRSVVGCSNPSATQWVDYFQNDLTDYHETQGIEKPSTHNRTHHKERDFASEVKALLE